MKGRDGKAQTGERRNRDGVKSPEQAKHIGQVGYREIDLGQYRCHQIEPILNNTNICTFYRTIMADEYELPRAVVARIVKEAVWAL